MDNGYGTWPYKGVMFLGSSAVERAAVNRLVVGSNPTRGAILTFTIAPNKTPVYGYYVFSGSVPKVVEK